MKGICFKKKILSILCGISLAFLPVSSFKAETSAEILQNSVEISSQKNYRQSASVNVSEEIGLVGNLFCISDSNNADNAALQWDTTLPAENFVLYRSTERDNGYTSVYEGTGTSYTDNNMEIGKTYYYQLKAYNGTDEWYSKVKELQPLSVPDNMNIYDNQKGSSLVYASSGTKIGDTYYNYSLKSHPGRNDIYLSETTSKDGVYFGNERVVADSSQNPDLESCKIESIHIEYAKWTNQIIVWAHWEKPSGYNDGKALVITGTPGGNFTVHHVYNPMGIQVRDMAIFFDDDGTGYLIAAGNIEGQGANATIYIFRMNTDYSDVTEIVKTLHEDQYREFPNMIKHDGYYFLFTSQAAGWYPSSGAYTVTDNLYGEWSELRSIGNTSTFSSQSGWVVNLKDKNYLMHAYRWLKASGTSGTTLCPLYFDNSFAFYDYYPSFKYSTATGELYPVQEGELLSQDKHAYSSLASVADESAEKAFDGSYRTAFKAISDYKKWPFSLEVDLENICELSNIQISWYIHKGSEGYYTYTVEGSTDGISWKTIYDHTDKNSENVTNTYGFNSNMLSGKARYVRLNVKNATLHNNPNNNWYTPTVYEVKIFGKIIEHSSAPSPLVKYDFEESYGDIVPDISGNNVNLILSGNADIIRHDEKGNVLYLDGSDETFVELPNGTLDGLRAYTISMDVKSESTGDFFTFAVGQDKEKYAFFKIADDHFRFATSIDTWRGESGMRYDLSGNEWHRYTFVVNGGVSRLYVDGIMVSETSELTSSLVDMGTNLYCYIGKSFYSDDVCFKGYIDNLTIYGYALNDKEILSDRIKGDVNSDGEFNVADAVSMHNYILGKGTLADWSAGDLCNDGEISVYDLIILRKMLIFG